MLRKVFAASLIIGTAVATVGVFSPANAQKRFAKHFQCDEWSATGTREEDTCKDRDRPVNNVAVGVRGALGPGTNAPGNPGNAKAVGNAGEFPTNKDFNFGPGTRGMSDRSGGTSSASNGSGGKGGGDKGGGDKGGGGGNGGGNGGGKH